MEQSLQQTEANGQQKLNQTGESDENNDAFMVWSKTERRKLALKFPNMLNCEISKLLGTEWSRMTEEEKTPYVRESQRLKSEQSQKL